ncbi:MAG: succinyl-diaminopimelate desuccinylase [Gammaproteobacteria bacterium]|nr:succinyl-diaminopimelate desuccinylase [Gammaproteobacteria bacterium]
MLKRFKNTDISPPADIINNVKALSISQDSSETINLAKSLIACPSITPNDAGVNDIIIQRLQKLGFKVDTFNRNGVSNFFAIKGENQPILVFAGHTDVVPAGKNANWMTDPFTPVVKDGFLYGRGASDMKGSLAAMVVAMENFVRRHPNHKGSLGIMITSDEEGDAQFGTQEIVKQLIKQGKKFDYCIVGEPTSESALGDAIRIGRRGSINCQITIHGKQGHVGYPEHLINPIQKSSKLIYKLSHKRWDLPSRYFPSTSCQLVRVHSESGALNVTPASLELTFNLRYSPRNSFKKIKAYVHKKVEKYGLEADIEWQHEAKPYLTKRGKLRKTVQKVLQKEMAITPSLTTAGGISDGRFIKQIAQQVIELGPSNKTIHQANECVSIEQLNQLTIVYEKVIQEILC